jgi:hypothetical protein
MKYAFGNPTYTSTAHLKDEILQNRGSGLDTFNIPVHRMTGYELSYLYWILTKTSKCSIKPLSLLHTNIWTAVKGKFQTYRATKYARNSVNQIWIFKEYKDPLTNSKAQNLSQVNSIKIYDFSTLYTTILHDDVYISQLIRYARACSTYYHLSIRVILLTNKLIPQGFLQSRLRTAFLRFKDLVYPYNLPLGHILSDMFHTNC